MRMSESLKRDVLEARVGGILNRFKIKRKRRDILFFEELLARYISECDRRGFGKETMRMGQEWMSLYFSTLLPDVLKRMPPAVVLNTVIKKIWQNLGLMDDFNIRKENGTIRIETKNEGMTRTIGKNGLMVGFYVGIINAMFSLSAEPVSVRQDKNSCEYVFKLHENGSRIKGRSKHEYRRLNRMDDSESGYTLKDALKNNLLTLGDRNRVYFRGKSLSPVENTIFHIIGNLDVLTGEIAGISHDFFRDFVKERGSDRKLSLLKTVFQIMGWGTINILIEGRGKIVMVIRNPPHGLGTCDNLRYLLETFLGYLWLIDRDLRIAEIKQTESQVKVTYSHQPLQRLHQ